MRHAMTRYVFEEVPVTVVKVVPCSGCHKPVRRQRTFMNTLNPWNVNADGTQRTRREIVEKLRAEGETWKTEPETCTPCLRKARS